ncbi:hypothetical protein CEXT_720411 [Caerostris extrusa]|uniref:Uncharacterized protein n=1 Tax=Caerostris extrusa TaxID=172846 RepID=A0AAV4N9X3_CAEEX|nr:hypothetical protein CEXT_720411 [Caerostris extrusa]
MLRVTKAVGSGLPMSIAEARRPALAHPASQAQKGNTQCGVLCGEGIVVREPVAPPVSTSGDLCRQRAEEISVPPPELKFKGYLHMLKRSHPKT